LAINSNPTRDTTNNNNNNNRLINIDSNNGGIVNRMRIMSSESNRNINTLNFQLPFAPTNINNTISSSSNSDGVLSNLVDVRDSQIDRVRSNGIGNNNNSGNGNSEISTVVVYGESNDNTDIILPHQVSQETQIVPFTSNQPLDIVPFRSTVENDRRSNNITSSDIVLFNNNNINNNNNDKTWNSRN
jgi:hypothetical protein